MPTCDICGKDISHSDMNVVTARVVVEATEKGYVPTKLPLEGLSSAFGFSKADSWHYTIQRNATVDWGLCADCVGEVRGYAPKKRRWLFWK